MTSHPYESSVALKRALKDLAKNQGIPSGRVQDDFIFDRFLHRVFSHAPEVFVLKGGRSLLARIPDARATRDIDLSVANSHNLASGIGLLREAGLLDKRDFLRFEYVDEAIITGQDLSRSYIGKRISFDVYEEGSKAKSLSVDVVSGCNITDSLTRITPCGRLTVPSLEYVDYLLFPIVDQIADKLSAIVEKHGHRDSSRYKDLADLVLIACHEQFSGAKLATAINSGFSQRNLRKPAVFAAPASWTAYPKKVRQFVPL